MKPRKTTWRDVQRIVDDTIDALGRSARSRRSKSMATVRFAGLPDEQQPSTSAVKPPSERNYVLVVCPSCKRRLLVKSPVNLSSQRGRRPPTSSNMLRSGRQVEAYAFAEMTAVFDRRSESRASRYSDHAEAVHDTLNALVDDVNKTTEIIRRRQREMEVERRTFQTEMEVNGRISVVPSDDWLNIRLKSVSTDDLKKDLGRVKDNQRNNVVNDTMAALVYDVNATAEVLRRGSLKRRKPEKKVSHEEVEYRLRLTPAPDDVGLQDHEEPPFEPPPDNFTVEQVKRDYGVDISESQTSSLKRRARSQTPRRTLHIDGSPPLGAIPVCAYCSGEIDGPTLTALAPNAERAQKFHPYHFMCCYCQKALNLRGTFREHERRPYCHECFYKLYNGLLYSPDENQRQIEKLI